jgi:hypothetical protein
MGGNHRLWRGPFAKLAKNFLGRHPRASNDGLAEHDLGLGLDTVLCPH